MTALDDEETLPRSPYPIFEKWHGAAEAHEHIQYAGALAQRVATLEERFARRAPVPRPPYWKAYRVRPRRVEFWEAKARRLHARIRYERNSPVTGGERHASGWQIRRLAP